MEYVTIEKREVSSEDVLTDQGLNNAKISELELMLKEMKKKLDKVNADA
ncbi:hypothetical protein [Methanobacterium sp. ACI-7]